MSDKYIVVYAEKMSQAIKYACALGGIKFDGQLIKINQLNKYEEAIKKDLRKSKRGYIQTTYNGRKYVITWGYGHMYGLKDAKDYNPEYKDWSKIPFPYFPDKYEVKPYEKLNAHRAIINKLFTSEKTELIINGTDFEREGELIFFYIWNEANNSGKARAYKRLRLNEQTETKIREGFDDNNLINADENKPYEIASTIRAILDWTVGINITAASTVYLSKNNEVFNHGRVITPVVNMIVENHREITNFQPKPFYEIKGTFTTPEGITYEGKLDIDRMEDKAAAMKILSKLKHAGNISSIEKRNKEERPPFPHSTQSLQTEGNGKYGLSLKQIADASQYLYDNGFITYPRVDSEYLTEDKYDEIED